MLIISSKKMRQFSKTMNLTILKLEWFNFVKIQYLSKYYYM
jgi:hypothetical protein